MRLLSLNILGGRYSPELLDFVREHKDSIDIFCFQEIFHEGRSTRPRMAGSNMNIFRELQQVLSAFEEVFSAHLDHEEGLAIFYHKRLQVQNIGEIFVHKHKHKDALQYNTGAYFGRQIQYILYKEKDCIYNVLNFHGLWDEKGKVDTAERIAQSNNIVSFIQTLTGKVILAGDFNYTPVLRSTKIIENAGLENLITTYNIPSTRSSLYTGPEPHADFVFVSRDITVKEFFVINNSISDHLPMIVEYT